MNNSNICKFSINRSSDLVCTAFVYETLHPLTERDVSDKFVIGLVTKGVGEFVRLGKSREISEGALFIARRDESFFVGGKGGFEYFYICFSGRRAEELIDRATASFASSVFDGCGGLRDFWLECIGKADDGNTELLSEAVVLYSLAHLKPEKKVEHSLISKIVMITEDNFRKPDFSLAALAEQLGYDAKYLSFVFKKKKGIAFTQYLRDMRIKHAIFLMEEGVVSVKNVAILSGFIDALYFSKIFKQCVGVSPKAYIENLEQNALDKTEKNGII